MGAKRHHYLPRFYLEYFLLEGGATTFWVYDKEGGEPRQQTPVNTCVEGHLYSLRNATGGKDDYLEREILSRLDGRAKPILDRWQDTGGDALHDDVPVIADFAAMLHTRVPRHMSSTEEIAKAVFRSRRRYLLNHPDELAKLVDSFRRDRPGHDALSVDEFRSMLAEFDKRFKLRLSPQHRLLMSLGSSYTVYQELMTMRWHLLNLEPGNTLVTCDAPVVVFLPDSRARAAFGGGLREPGVEVVFPVSPRVCLYLDRRSDNARVVANASFCRKMNRRIVYNAERYVISSKEDRAIAKIVREFSKTRGRPKIDTEQIHRRIDWSKQGRGSSGDNA